MPLEITKRLFTLIRYLFFEGLSVKFPPGTAKKLIDFLYVTFEKISIKFDLLSSYYLEMYQEIVDKEIKMAGISSKDQVVVIGCGSLPITAVLVAKISKAHVVAIDNDKRAVNEAAKYIRKQHLENRVDIEYADGKLFQINSFDVIYLAYGLKKKEEIFDVLIKSSKKNSRIIFRTVIGTDEEKKKNITELSKWFLVKDSIKSDIMPPSGSYLLFRKD
ncbi:hypothetical protein AYK24_04770 [Thermoplasmatales archaeon SG8-52-4]|nr:MAG: hypothetical protein AYK24_04770 [Thermoplasmatales archaeon SG8-52-4]